MFYQAHARRKVLLKPDFAIRKHCKTVMETDAASLIMTVFADFTTFVVG